MSIGRELVKDVFFCEFKDGQVFEEKDVLHLTVKRLQEVLYYLVNVY